MNARTLDQAAVSRFRSLPTTAPIKQAMALTNAAHSIAIERMVGTFGNKLSEAHNEALYRTAGLFSVIALKLKSGRLVADMPTGAGKTTSVVSWLAAVHSLRLDISVTIAASQVEALATMIRDLESLGVPRDKIGLLHSKEYDPTAAEKLKAAKPGKDYDKLIAKFASEPTTAENEKRPFLFVSHQRIRVAAEDPSKETMLVFNGRKRDLLIWDECMMTTRATAATMTDIRSGIGGLKPHAWAEGPDSKLALAVNYLTICDEWIEQEYKRQCDNQEPKGLNLPVLGEAELDAFSTAVSVALGDESRAFPALQMLLEASGQELRLARMGDIKSALIGYRVTIPASLNDVVILDAGHVVNRLVEFDPTIRRDEWFAEQASQGIALKTFENVTVHFAAEKSGRSAMEEAYAKRKTNPFASKLVEAVASIPDHEAAIIFTFKHKRRSRPDIPALIKQDLKNAGVDPDALLPNGKPRITILTWGQHTSLNEYAHASNVLFAGILHLDDETLVATAIGQTGNLLTPLDDRFNVADLKRGDIAGAIYQALSRGSCRYTEDGKAKPMRVWLCHYDTKIKDELERVMPGLTWADWDIGNKRDTAKAETISLQILALLRDHPGDRISNRAIKAALNIPAKLASTFTLVTRTLEVPGWRREGASFVREGSAEAFGFQKP